VNASLRDWQRLQNILLLLLVLCFCLYLPTLLHDAFADDEIYLAYTNRFLREAPLRDLYQLLLRPGTPWEFLPLRDFTYWLDFRIYGDEPNGFHATNLFWYAASGLALFWLFREFVLLCRPAWASRASVLALCGTLLFVVHPAHVEVAAWIASRKDLIAGTLGFLALAVLARALRRGWPAYEMMLSALLLFAACFGKASAMTGIVPVTVLIGMGWRASPEISQAKKLGYLTVFCCLVATAFLIHLTVGETTGIRIENHPGLFLMLERASRIFTAQLGILLFPYPLRFYYDVYLLGNWHWLVSVSSVLLLIVSVLVLTYRRSLAGLGVVLAFSPLLVYLQLMPFTTWSLASERFAFVAVAGLALLLVEFFGRLDRPRIIGGLMIVIAVPCALLVWSRVDEWGGGRSTLLAHEYALQPAFHNAIRDQIGFTLLPEKRYDEAAVLARQVPRAFASEGLLAFIETEQAFRRLSDARSAAVGSEDTLLRQEFCRAALKLRLAKDKGYALIPEETDVSYNNILRSLDYVLKYRFAEAKLWCVDAESGASR
jgi:nitrous oxide reductase accessory protein NosL